MQMVSLFDNLLFDHINMTPFAALATGDDDDHDEKTNSF